MEDKIDFVVHLIGSSSEVCFRTKTDTPIYKVTRSIEQRQGLSNLILFIDDQLVEDTSAPCSTLMGAHLTAIGDEN